MFNIFKKKPNFRSRICQCFSPQHKLKLSVFPKRQTIFPFLQSHSQKSIIKIGKKFHHLFFPHQHNNFRSKLLHHDSLQKIIVLLLVVQLSISFTLRLKPGVLGFASNISVGDIYSATNSQRQSAGLATLSLNSSLSQSATAKANHMFSHNYWAHNAPDGTTPWYFFRSVGYTYLYAGENLARDFGDSSSVLSAWMNSPTHRENILSGRYDEIGIGVVNGTLDGQETTLVVQHFGKKASPQVASDTTNNTATAPNLPAQEKQPEIAFEEPAEVIEEVIETKPQLDGNANLILTTPTAEFQVKASRIPLSSFQITKTFNIIIAVLLILVLFVDGLVIYRHRLERRTGKNLVHIFLFILITIILILSSSGRII